MKEQLLEVALSYSSEKEFKAKNLPKYLLARKHRLLRLAFPPEVVVPKIIGVYYLYLKTKLNYIGYSLEDCMKAIGNTTNIPYDNYKIRQMHSTADIVTVATYLQHQLKPPFNEGLPKDSLTLLIPNEILRKTWYNTIRSEK